MKTIVDFKGKGIKEILEILQAIDWEITQSVQARCIKMK